MKKSIRTLSESDIHLWQQSGLVRFDWNLTTGENYFYNSQPTFFLFDLDQINNTPNFLESLNKDNFKPFIKNITEKPSSTFCFEWSVIGSNGNTFWLQLKGNLQVINNKQILLQGFISDISEIKTVKEALLKAEQEKMQFIDSMIDSAVFIGPDFKIKYANNKFKEQYPQFNNTLKGLKCHKVIHNMDNPCLNCSLELVLNSKTPHRTVRKIKNGPSILSVTFPVFNNKNQLEGAVITYRDITESKNIEKALKKEATINKVLAEISQTILLPELSEENIAKKILSTALSITKSSTGFVSSLNTETKQLEWQVSENYSLKAITEDHEPCLNDKKYNCLINRMQAKKVPFISNHLKDFLAENNIFECSMTRENCLMVPATFNDELIGQIYVSGSDRPYMEHDIVILKQLASVFALSIYRLNMERELIKAKNEAEENNKLKSAFLANMSHEIRSPMNAITGYTELLRNTEQPPLKQKQFLDVIFKSSNQLLNIINNILDLSKIEVGQLKINKHDYDLNQLILDALQTLPPNFFNESDIEIKTILPIKGSKALIHCDSSRIQQVITNLLNNALKFTYDGFIELGYEIKDATIIFHVKDTGIGIPKSKHRLIFERFGQTEEGYARNFEGAGLGLPICKGFIELMGGTIWLDSEPQKGTTFYFTIPYEQALSLDKSNQTDELELDLQWNDKKILIVEDDTFNQSYLDTLLLPSNAKIIHATDGFEALNKVRLHPDIDLILMDIRLPRLDGIEATKKIRLLGFYKPIIAQTAHSSDEDRNICLEAGCTDFITKPINRIELLKIIHANLDS
ncbi:MAG: ATP-binding protein [Salinivirgaceae bacterium]